MEAIRKYIDASSLMTVMSLPETFKNRKLEVLINGGTGAGKGRCCIGSTVVDWSDSCYRYVIGGNAGRKAAQI